MDTQNSNGPRRNEGHHQNNTDQPSIPSGRHQNLIRIAFYAFDDAKAAVA